MDPWRPIEDYLEILQKWFRMDKTQYAAEVAAFESLTGFRLNRQLAPHLFSGNIERPKMVFLTLNPKEPKEPLPQNGMASLSEFRNNFRRLYDSGRRRIPTFQRMNQMASRILHEEIEWTYSVLHSSCVDIDFVPFYSKHTNFRVQPSHPQFKRQVALIERYFYDIGARFLVIIGQSLQSTFLSMNTTGYTFYEYRKGIADLVKPGIAIKRTTNKKIVWISHSLTSYGMEKHFYVDFVADILDGERKFT